jgi:hypothetical protein
MGKQCLLVIITRYKGAGEKKNLFHVKVFHTCSVKKLTAPLVFVAIIKTCSIAVSL